jgi:hypothetical protein
MPPTTAHQPDRIVLIIIITTLIYSTLLHQ